MPSIQKSSKGYRAQVAVKGVRESASFRTKREAEAWAFSRESELRSTAPVSQRFTLEQALNRYAEEVSPTKRGERWEAIRIAAFKKMPHIPKGKLCDLTPDDFGKWRDARIKEVSAGTVLREIALLSAVLETARREWRWIAANPIADIRKPKQPEHRSTLIKPMEAVKLLRAMGYHSGPCKSASEAVANAFMCALLTGMRAGEICSLRWADVDESIQTGSKTAASRRTLPVTSRLRRILSRMEGFDRQLVFGLRPQTLDTLFRRYRDRTKLLHLHFHDTRHTAATRLARVFDVLTLCKYFGWSNPKMAMVYYNPTPQQIREQLERDQPRKSEQTRKRSA